MNLKLLKQICSIPKDRLEKKLVKSLQSFGYRNLIYCSDYIIAEGDIPVCLVAHMDVVFRFQPNEKEFLYDSNKQVLWYPGGAGFDDRAGIYAIIKILEAGFRPSVIFTDGEEKGCLGATKLIKDFPKYPFKKECKCIIQLDRANKNDMVFYDCDNAEFIKYIGKYGFKEDYGSFSDISCLAPSWGIAAVNLSIGYEDEHSGCERLHCKWCDVTIEKVKKILREAGDMPAFTYIPFVFQPKSYNLEKCLICNQSLGKISYKIFAQNPYNICEECFNKYYDKNNIIYSKEFS